ncbi:MAG: hypothetical protein LW884_00400 [Bacteroidetes bacterium]|jgi:hypothetical protein|nr:hypothetical protein [Bacteroidota bacterium]
MLLCVLPAVQAQQPESRYPILDEEYGFMDIRLGTPLDSLPGLVRAPNDYERKARYTRPGASLYYAGVQFGAVEYLFWEDRLHSIRLRTEGVQNTDRLLELLKLYYGEPVQPGFEQYYTWDGLQVQLILDANILTHNGWTTFMSKPLNASFSKTWRR